jgi:hypothetical protein
MAGKLNEKPRPDATMLEHVRIIFRNLEGRADRYQAAGKRTFGVILEPDVAAALEKAGWTVKYLNGRVDDQGNTEDPQAWIKVTLRMDADSPKPGKLVMVSNGVRTQLPEAMAKMIDSADIDFVDVKITPYFWEMNGNTGYTAYVDTMYVVLRLNELDAKYSDMEEAHLSSVYTGTTPDPDALEAEANAGPRFR